MSQAIRANHGARFVVFGLSNTLHRIAGQIFEIDPGNDTFRLAMIDLSDMYAIHHSNALMREPNRAFESVAAFLTLNPIHERGRIDAPKTRLLDRLVAEVSGAAATGSDEHKAQRESW